MAEKELKTAEEFKEYERQFGTKASGAVWRLRRYIYANASKDPLLIEAWNYYKEKIFKLASNQYPGFIVLKRLKNKVIIELHFGMEVIELVYPPSPEKKE